MVATLSRAVSMLAAAGATLERFVEAIYEQQLTSSQTDTSPRHALAAGQQTEKDKHRPQR